MTKSLSYWCSPRLLKVLYTSMILLLWVCGLYLCCLGNEKDDNIKIVLMSIIIPIMCITIITFPFIIYMGGCVVALPDACKDVFPPRACCSVSPCGGAELGSAKEEDKE